MNISEIVKAALDAVENTKYSTEDLQIIKDCIESGMTPLQKKILNESMAKITEDFNEFKVMP
jgi:hypothetical protein